MCDANWHMIEAGLAAEDSRAVQGDIDQDDVRYGQLLVLVIGLTIVVVGHVIWWVAKWLVGW